MKNTHRTLMQTVAAVTGALFLMSATPAIAQEYGAPPTYGPGQLENLVSRIALYPDPLLAQVLAASTFPDQIPEAARWANENRNLQSYELANAISQANLPFDPSIQALIPFPTVLDMLASDPNWTNELGNAVLAQRPDVMDAIQVMRRRAESYGYLRSNDRMRVVATSAAVEILPYDPGFVCVPVYDPYVVYAPPRPGFFVGAAIGFRGGFAIGSAFSGWGWGGGFNWYNHAVIVNNAPWGRTWYNRGSYVPSYTRWNGGRWQNTYGSRNVIVNNVNVNRTVNNESFYRNQGGSRYNSGYNAPAPVMTNRGYSNGYSNGSRYDAQNSYRGSQQNQVAPAPAQNGYRGYQQNRVAPSQGYTNSSPPQNNYRPPEQNQVMRNRGYSNSYSNNDGVVTQNVYRGGQQSSAMPARGFERQAVISPSNGAANARTNQSSGATVRDFRDGARRR